MRESYYDSFLINLPGLLGSMRISYGCQGIRWIYATDQDPRELCRVWIISTRRHEGKRSVVKLNEGRL